MLKLACPISGVTVGLGKDEESAIADAMVEACYFDHNGSRVECSEAFIRQQIADGKLTFHQVWEDEDYEGEDHEDR